MDSLEPTASQQPDLSDASLSSHDDLGTSIDDLSTETSSQSSSRIFNQFHGCYCLVSQSDKRHYKGRTYIGYTVNPNRRIVQHNSGRTKGGAKKTDSRGPWHMVMIVHGFMNATDALRFEWAWQNPDKSRRVRQLGIKKRARESPLWYRFRIVCAMLHCRPWTHTPLTLRWLKPEYQLPIPEEWPLQSNHSQAQVNQSFQAVKKRYYIAGVLPADKSEWPYVIAAPDMPQNEQRICRICWQNINLLTDVAYCWDCTSVFFHVCCLAEQHCDSTDSTQPQQQLIRPLAVRMNCCNRQRHWADVVRHCRAAQMGM